MQLYSVKTFENNKVVSERIYCNVQDVHKLLEKIKRFTAGGEDCVWKNTFYGWDLVYKSVDPDYNNQVLRSVRCFDAIDFSN